jgi:HPr kinase/phosphorylase
MILKSFIEKNEEYLGLECLFGEEYLSRKLEAPECERPGLSLFGHLRGFSKRRILLFGKAETAFLERQTAKQRYEILKNILTGKTPCIILCRKLSPSKEMLNLCVAHKIPLLRSFFSTIQVMNRLITALMDAFSPVSSCHGSLMEIFGIGVLIQGDAAVGKSEAALGLVERGHRLVSDDIVKLRSCEGGRYLEGSGVDTSLHRMEIKGIGIINVASQYGMRAVREKKILDLVVKLEVWNDSHFYDRKDLNASTISLLGLEVPFHILPVKPGRNVVLLLETLALNHKLKELEAFKKVSIKS